MTILERDFLALFEKKEELVASCKKLAFEAQGVPGLAEEPNKLSLCITEMDSEGFSVSS